MPQWLESVGRFHWDPHRNPPPEVRVDTMYLMAQADPDGFLRDLAALAVPAGGWVALGAKALVMDILPIETNTPDFNALVLAGFQFLRQNGVPPNRLSMNDRTLWERVRPGNEPWLIWRSAPEGPPTPLQPGEQRKVAQVLRADGYINEIIIRQDAPDKFVAMVLGPKENGEPDPTPFDWHTQPSLQELYVRIGESQQTAPYWATPELVPYFPLPAPSI
jgi:hypothetical protein